MKANVNSSVSLLILLLQLDWKLCAAKSKRANSQPKSSHVYHYSNYGNYGGNPDQYAESKSDTESDSPYGKDYSQNYANYGFDYNAGGVAHDYQDETKSEPLQCFSCHYHVQYGHIMGMEECNDPFDGSVIPDVVCEGPCGKVYRKLDSIGEFMIARNCMPSCKEVQTVDGYTQCCSTSMCNAATRLHLTSSYWTILVTCALTLTAKIFQLR